MKLFIGSIVQSYSLMPNFYASRDRLRVLSLLLLRTYEKCLYITTNSMHMNINFLIAKNYDMQVERLIPFSKQSAWKTRRGPFSLSVTEGFTEKGQSANC